MARGALAAEVVGDAFAVRGLREHSSESRTSARRLQGAASWLPANLFAPRYNCAPISEPPAFALPSPERGDKALNPPSAVHKSHIPDARSIPEKPRASPRARERFGARDSNRHSDPQGQFGRCSGPPPT